MFWGNPTASMDWCEPNYVVSDFVAEFWNTMSSVPIAAVGIYGAYLARREKMERRVVWSYLAVALIGLGSIAFHGTLLAWGQALDELPMLYGSLVFLFSLLESTHSSETLKHGPMLPLGLALLAVAVTVAYATLENYFAFFLITYVSTVFLMCVLAYRVFASSVHVAHRRLFLLSAVVYVSGFLFLWIPEQLLCEWYVSHGWHPHLHAWFHLTSSVGPFCFVQFIAFERYRRIGRRPTISFDGIARLPVVRFEDRSAQKIR